MYFDEFKKVLIAMNENKASKLLAYKEEIKEAEEKLRNSVTAKEEALESGNDKEYLKQTGLVAVNEARLERLSADKKSIVLDDTVKELLDDINEAYRHETSQRANNIFKHCDKLIKEAEDLDGICEEYFECVSLIEELQDERFDNSWIGMLQSKIYKDSSDISALKTYLNNVIAPECENGNSKSIRGYAYRLNYNPKINK